MRSQRTSGPNTEKTEALPATNPPSCRSPNRANDHVSLLACTVVTVEHDEPSMPVLADREVLRRRGRVADRRGSLRPPMSADALHVLRPGRPSRRTSLTTRRAPAPEDARQLVEDGVESRTVTRPGMLPGRDSRSARPNACDRAGATS